MQGGPQLRRRQAITAAVLLALVAASTASAQFPGGGTPGSRSGQKGGGTQGAERAPGPASAAERAAQGGVTETARFQLRELEEDLKLAPVQRPLWAAYADRVSKLADDVARSRNAVRFPQGTAAEQLDFVAETLRNRLTAVEDIADAGKALYAVLSAEQKAIADRRLARIEIPLLVPAQPIADGGAGGMPRSGGPGGPAPRAP